MQKEKNVCTCQMFRSAKLFVNYSELCYIVPNECIPHFPLRTDYLRLTKNNQCKIYSLTVFFLVCQIRKALRLKALSRQSKKHLCCNSFIAPKKKIYMYPASLK